MTQARKEGNKDARSVRLLLSCAVRTLPSVPDFETQKLSKKMSKKN